MNTLDWMQIDIRTESAGVEPVCAALSELGAGGFSIRDPADLAAFLAQRRSPWEMIDPSLLELLGAPTLVTLYLPCNEQGREQLETVRRELARLKTLDAQGEWGSLEYTVSTVREENWETAWKQYYKPVRISQRLLVAPSWEPVEPAAGQAVVRLDPGMAFGTGTHDSTRLCLELLERHLRPGGRMLDVGCGSGILAIAAVLLGAGSALGVDIDELAVRIAGENAVLNSVQDRAEFVRGDLADRARGRFELIAANIVADVIIAFAPQAPALLAQEGVLLVSGIIEERLGGVRAALSASGLREIECRRSGGWAALACRAG